MPNYVKNRLTVTGEMSEIQRMLQNVSTDDRLGILDFRKIIPLPDEIRNAMDGHELSYNGADSNSWCYAHWGTKWNAFEGTYDPDSGQLTFCTAWSAPHQIMETLSAQYPELSFHHEWADEDLGENCGAIQYNHGQFQVLWEPDTQRDSVDYALDIWGETAEDIGIRLSQDESRYISIQWPPLPLVDCSDRMALFTQQVLTKAEMPQGLYQAFWQTENGGKTLVDRPSGHMLGTLLSNEPWDFGEQGRLQLSTSPHISDHFATLEDLVLGNLSLTETEQLGQQHSPTL